MLAVNPADANRVDRQCTMPLSATFAAEASLTGKCDAIANIGYTRATGFGLSDRSYEVAGKRGWWREEVACAALLQRNVA